MLDHTVAAEFVPGSNLSGDLACADWRFLLPDFSGRDALCLGVPSANPLRVLSRIARHVWVATTSRDELKDLRRSGREQGAEGIAPVCLKDFSNLPFADGSLDLIWLKDDSAVSAFLGGNRIATELARVLGAEGTIYCEVNGPVEVLRSRRLARHLAPLHLKPAGSFWLAPFHGEPRTAVPVNDSSISSYFFSRVLYGQSPRSQKLSRVGEAASRLGVLPYVVWRRGFLIERSADGNGTTHPPKYLARAASASGLNLEGFRFGFSAHGKYNSNKVVFFLFGSSSQTPDVVVKATRTPEFNERLEREYQVLSLLKEKAYVPAESYPEPLFLKYHGDLAFLGEKAAPGRPFRRQTRADTRCPIVRKVVEWITKLGKASARDQSRTPGNLGLALERLLAKFVDIYQLSEEEYRFLKRQVALLRLSSDSIPAVFLHGDASPWNILVSGEKDIVFLDWEAAEPQGVPLWDLYYFMYNFGCWVSRKKGQRNKLASFSEQFLEASPLSAYLQEAAADYCREIGMDGRLIEPLFYTCWIHRALRESVMLPPARLRQGEFFNLLRLSIQRRKAPGLSALFSMTGAMAREIPGVARISVA